MRIIQLSRWTWGSILNATLHTTGYSAWGWGGVMGAHVVGVESRDSWDHGFACNCDSWGARQEEILD